MIRVICLTQTYFLQGPFCEKQKQVPFPRTMNNPSTLSKLERRGDSDWVKLRTMRSGMEPFCGPDVLSTGFGCGCIKMFIA